jgi:Carboxypeptidase regulatory-like domain
MSRAVFGVLTATVMIAVALLLWWQVRDEVSTIPVESDLELETPTDQTGDRADQPTHDRKLIDPNQPGAEVVAKTTLRSHPGSLVVRVQFSDKTPAAGIGVGFQLVPRYAVRRPWVWLKADTKGEVRIESVDAYRVIVLTDRQPDEPRVAKIEPEQETELVYVLKEGIHLQGIVVDKADVPIAAAEVVLSGWASQRATAVTVSDANGRFEVREVGETVNVGARKPGFAPSPMRTIMAGKGAAFDVKIRMPGAGGGVRGRVVDVDGEGIEGAELKFGYLNFDGRVLMLPDGTRGMYPRSYYVLTVADGSFEVQGIEAGETNFQVRADEYVPVEDKVEVEAHVTTLVNVRLMPGATCIGTVRDEKGKLLPRIDVRHGRYRRPTHRQAVTDENGAFRLAGLPSGTIVLSIYTEKQGKAKQEFTVRPGETFRWDVELSRGLVIVGHVTNDKGQPVEKPWVEAQGVSVKAESWHVHETGDKDGKFELVDAPPDATIKLTVRAQEHAPIVGKKVHTSTRRLELQLKYEGQPTGRVIGKLCDPDGKSITNAQITLHKKDDIRGGGGINPVKKDGSILLDKLRPGTYELRARAGAFPDWRSGWFDLPRGETKDLGEIRVERGGKVRIDVPGFTEKCPCTFQVFSPDGKDYFLNIPSTKPPVISRALPTGDYLLRTRGGKTVPLARKFTIKAGETTRLPMPIQAGTSVDIYFAKIDVEDPPDRVEFVITGPDGFRHESYSFRYRRSGHYGRTFALRPGEYQLQASTKQGRRGRREFTVGESQGKAVRIETALSR